MEKANYRIVGMAAAFSPEIANSSFFGCTVKLVGSSSLNQIAPMLPAVEASGS